MILKFDLLQLLTITAANRGSLDIASTGEGQSLSLINIDPEWGGAAINDLTQTLRLWLDNIS